MVSVLLIGMGKFGRTLGERLLAMGDEVMIVDKDEDVINTLAPKYTNALICNCMVLENLRQMDIPSFDVCVVAVSEDFQSSLEITSNLKDLGAKRIVSKAATDIQSKFLTRVGADEVIYPDNDIAEALAVKINSKKVVNFIDLDGGLHGGHSIFEIELPKKWQKRKLIDINPRGKYGMNILTVKKGSVMLDSLDGNYVFEEGDVLVVYGNTERILKFANK